MHRFIFAAFVISASFQSCMRVPHEDGSWVSAQINERIQKEVSWQSGTKEDLLVEEKIQELTKHELTKDLTLQIALLNNPTLQEAFEDIGIAQADLVEAGLFHNPIFEAYARFPNRNAPAVNTQYSVVQNFLDIFLIPLAKKTASLQLEQTKIRVANFVLSFASDVEQTFFSLQNALMQIKMQKKVLEVQLLSEELACRQLRVGNIPHFEYEKIRASKQQAEIELKQLELESITLSEKLTVLMGLKHKKWRVIEKIEPLPQSEETLADLEQIALQERFDVLAARKELEIIASFGAQKKWWSYVNGQIGISSEKEADKTRETGPVVSLEIPIFNYGQADRARLLAKLRQSQKKLEALENEVKAEVRTHQENLSKLRNIVRYYDQKIVPLRKKIIDSTQKQYNIMAYGIYELLQDKQKEIEAEMQYEKALRDYWITRSLLEKAVGGKLRRLSS